MKVYPALLFSDQVMSSRLKYLITCWIFLVSLCAASVNAAPQGILEGQLRILSDRPVELADENTATRVRAENYTDYPLIVLTRDGKKQVARITADRNGKYRAALPAGDYILDVEGRTAKRVHAGQQQFTVSPNETVRVDMNIIRQFANPPS